MADLGAKYSWARISKWPVSVAYKLAAALGVAAELKNSSNALEAVVWLALPLTELGTRDEIRTHFQSLLQQGFSFRGQPLQVQGSLQVFPEGFGLYLNRKQQLKSMGQAISQRRTLIVMMGHRNLSVFRFEAGSLKATGSSSNGPGFWPIFEKSTRALGVTKPDYGALMNAIVTGQGKQISAARGRLFDFGEQLVACRDNYWQAMKIYSRYLFPPILKPTRLPTLSADGKASLNLAKFSNSLFSMIFGREGSPWNICWEERGPLSAQNILIWVGRLYR